MPFPLEPAHSHTASLRLAGGEEVLIVRVLMRDGVAGYGFTFREDIAAARRMACWDAAARAAGKPLWQVLRESRPETRAELEATVDDATHSWSRSWRAVLDVGRGTSAAPTPNAPSIDIDWTLEPGFKTLHWIEPERN